MNARLREMDHSMGTWDDNLCITSGNSWISDLTVARQRCAGDWFGRASPTAVQRSLIDRVAIVPS